MIPVIDNYRLGRLNNKMCCQALNSVVGCMSGYDMVALLIDGEATDLINMVQIFDQLVLQPRTSSETERLKVLDEQRDNMIVGLNSLIDPYLKHPDKAKLDAAHALRTMLDSYGKYVYNMTYQEESTTLTVIVRELESEMYAPMCTTLGLDAWIADLKSCNEAFIALYDVRDLNNSTYVEGSTKTARTNAEQRFYTFCDMVNSHAKVSGVEPYLGLIQGINEIVSQTKNRSHQKGPHNEEEKKNMKK